MRRRPLALVLLAVSALPACASEEEAVRQPPVEENRVHAHEMSDRMQQAVEDERADEQEKLDAMLEDGQTDRP